MVTYLRRAVLVIGILLLGCASAPAAMVRCATDGHYNVNQTDDWFIMRWPSGVRPTDKTCSEGFIFGAIEKGDFEKVAKFYRANHPFLYSFKIVSQGGNAAEAMKIGRLIRKYMLYVSAPLRIEQTSFEFFNLVGREPECNGDEACVCASACALIALGGVRRFGTLGLHRIRIVDPAFAALKAMDATQAYNDGLSMVRAYLKDMEVSDQLIDKMVNTSSAKISWVNVDRTFEKPPSIAEWEDANCPPLSDGEEGLISSILHKPSGNRTPSEKKGLSELTDRKVTCPAVLLSRSRDSLAPP